MAAVMEGDEGVLKTESNADATNSAVQNKLDEHKTPLIIACEQGDVEEVKALLKENPLYIEQCDTITKEMYAHTANTEILPTGAPPLHWAVKHQQIVAILLAYGAKPDSLDSQGNTAIHIACATKSAENSLRILLNKKSGNIKIKNAEGDTPAMVAVQQDNYQALIELKKSYYPNINELIEIDGKQTCLVIAAAFMLQQDPARNFRTVMFFLAHGALVTEKGIDDSTLLQIAVSTPAGDSERNKPYIDACLHSAHQKIHDEIAVWLAEKMLHVLFEENRSKIVKKEVELNSLNKQNLLEIPDSAEKIKQQTEALYSEIQKAQDEFEIKIESIIQELTTYMRDWIKQFYNPETDYKQMLSNHLAAFATNEIQSCIQGYQDRDKQKAGMLKELVKPDRGFLVNYNSRKIQPQLTSELLSFLLGCGFKRKHGLESYNALNVTPLIQAAATGRVEFCKELLDLGVNINQANNHTDLAKHAGKTALHYAASKGHDTVVSLLLDRKANIEQKCRKQSTPLLYAVADNQYSTAKLLLEAGADPNPNGCPISPLYFALYNLREDFAILLVEHGANIYEKVKDCFIVDAILGSLEICQKYPKAAQNQYPGVQFTEAHREILDKLIFVYAKTILASLPQDMARQDKYHKLKCALQGLSKHAVRQQHLVDIGKKAWGEYLGEVNELPTQMSKLFI